MPTTCNAVLCTGIVERDAAIKLYKTDGRTVVWYGPFDLVSGEKITPPDAIDQKCEAGPKGYLVVASDNPLGTPHPA